MRDKGGDLRRLMKKGTIFFGHDLGVLMMLPAMACYTRDFLKYHGCGEYCDRFAKFGQLNKDLYLNNIYRDDVSDCDGEFGISLEGP